MTTRISAATGNWTAAGTWGAVDAASLLNSESANSALTTSYQASSNFTPAAGTYDGHAVKIASVTASPSGTFSTRLEIAGVAIAGTEVTVDVADLSLCTTTDLAGGFVFFKWAAPVVLAAVATNVAAKTSASSQVNLFSSATTNWSRLLRTTTTGAPAATDLLYVLGELTGQGTGNDITVTVDSTASTAYGADGVEAGVPVNPAVAVGKRGILTWGTTAATAYLLVMKGSFVVWAGGTHQRGTTGTKIPRDSTAELRITGTGTFHVYGYYVRNLGTDTAQGQSRTSGKNVVVCKLNTDEAVNSTSLGVDTDTGWLDNDVIRVASTTQTASQSELGAMAADAGASTLTVDGFGGAGGGLANAHSGTSPTQAEVINLTRNVFINFNGDQNCTIQFDQTAIVDWDWAGVIGTSQGTVTINTTTGSLEMDYCVPTSKSSGASVTVAGAAHNNWAIRNCVSTGSITVPATTGTGYILDNWTAVGAPSASFSDVGGTITNITIGGGGFAVGEAAGIVGTISGLMGHSGSAASCNGGIGTLTDLSLWRSTSSFFIGATGTNECLIDGLTLFGNTTSNLSMTQTQCTLSITIKDLISAGDTTFATTNGINIGGNGFYANVVLENPQLSPSGGIYAAHTNDINIAAAGCSQIYLNNPIMGGTNRVTGQSSLFYPGGVFATRLGQTDGANQSWLGRGTVAQDNTLTDAGNPSVKLTPTSATRKLNVVVQSTVCDEGETLDFNIMVRQDATYNGNPPRLMLKANAAMGISVDQVLDTATGTTDSFLLLTGTTPAALADGVWTVFVDCDGTAGFINLANASVS